MPARAAARAAARGNRPTMASFGPLQRIGRGALMGLAFPGAFTILILIMYLVGGRYQTDRTGSLDTLVLLIAYPTGSAIMGAVLGFALPFMRNWVSAALVGMVALAPLIIGIALSSHDAGTPWAPDEAIIAAIMIAVFGSALGISVLRSGQNTNIAGSA
jgi:hypothetical protein